MPSWCQQFCSKLRDSVWVHADVFVILILTAHISLDKMIKKIKNPLETSVLQNKHSDHLYTTLLNTEDKSPSVQVAVLDFIRPRGGDCSSSQLHILPLHTVLNVPERIRQQSHWGIRKQKLKYCYCCLCCCCYCEQTSEPATVSSTCHWILPLIAWTSGHWFFPSGWGLDECPAAHFYTPLFQLLCSSSSDKSP